MTNLTNNNVAEAEITEDTILIIVYTIFYLITFVYCLVSVLSGSGLFNRRGRGTNPESFKQKVLTVNESVSQRNRTGISEDRFLTNYR